MQFMFPSNNTLCNLCFLKQNTHYNIELTQEQKLPTLLLT